MANETSGLATRGQLADAVAQKLQDLGSPRRNIVLTDLDEGYRQALRRFPWPSAMRIIETGLAIQGGQAYFFLPKEVASTVRILDGTVPNLLNNVGLDTLADFSFGFLGMTGIACHVAEAGASGINTVLAPATPLQILSSGTDLRTGFIEGILAGQSKRLAFTLASATPVSLGNWDEVSKLYVATASGTGGLTVTIRQVADSAIVGMISPYETSSVYRRYRVWPIPQQTTQLKIIYKYTPPAILDEAHEYVIPIIDFLQLFAWGRGLQQRRQFGPGNEILQQAEATLTMTWLESRGHRTDQYVPASPYACWGGD